MSSEINTIETNKQDGLFHKIFIWMAGADSEILNTCSNAEKNKQVGIGSLILIPMTLSGISMGFAIFTISERFGISFIFGCIWAGFILLIDRFLVSTFVKTDNWKNDIKSMAVGIRLLFALAVGFTVSHPLVIFIFDSDIQEYIVRYSAKEQDKVNKENKSQNEPYQIELKRLKDSLSKIDDKIECLTIARNLEGNSSIPQTILCKDGTSYRTSGRLNHGLPGSESRIFDNDIQRNNERRTEISNDIKRINFIIDKSEKKITSDSIALQKVQSYGYLKRSTTLSKMGDELDIGLTVKITKWFLILFFWLVDILPVFLKIFLVKYGDYDKKLEEKEELKRLKATNQLQTDREKTLLERYLAKYKYDMNRELGRINLEHIFRFKELKIKKSIYKDFSSADELKKYLEDNAKME